MAEYFYTPPTDEEVAEYHKNNPPKATLMELDFQEKAVTIEGDVLGSGRTTFIDLKAWDEVVLPSIASTWHDAGKDEIKFLLFYTDGTYLCQRKKTKFDFTTKTTYWVDYNYKDGKASDVDAIYKNLKAVCVIQREMKLKETLERVRELENTKLDYYYDLKWWKKLDEIQKMLLYSDFRVLADTPIKYADEKADWVIWRNKMRNLLPEDPRSEFDTNFAMFKFVTTVKYPIDPRGYFKKYPNQEVEYLSTDDQFTKHDFEASVDFYSKTQVNLINFLESYDNDFRPIDAEVLEIAKQLKLETVYNGLDYNRFEAE